MRVAAAPSIRAVCVLLSACSATIPEGQYECASSEDCPPAWLCVGSGDDGRCYSHGRDAAVPLDDAGDAGRDAASLDGGGGEDAGSSDAALPVFVELAVRQAIVADGSEAAGALFGASLDLFEGELLVGAPGAGPPASAGAAYLFEPGSGAAGFGVTPLTFPGPGSPAAADQLGFAVALLPDNQVVGRPGADAILFAPVGAGTSSGRASPSAFFGSALARLSSTEVLVGARLASSNRGAAFRFMPTGGALIEIAPSSAADADDVFGSSLAVGVDYVAIGAPARTASREAYVDVYNRADLSSVTRISSTRSEDKFGVAVAFVPAGFLAVGADQNTSGASADGVGRVDLFDLGTWDTFETLTSPDNPAFDRFGASICASGDLVVVGAPLASTRRGRAHVYRVAEGSVERVAELIPPGDASAFGSSCAIDGSLVVVGAPDTEVDGLVGAGTVYAFNLASLDG